MALGNGSTPNGGVTQEKAPVVNGTNMETLPRTGKQTDPNTAFLRAARAGQLDKIQEYLDSGTVRDINTSNANGLNALHLASKDGHVDIVRELLKRGAIVDAATKKGNTSLHIASLAGQEEVVRLLIQHGASLNVQSQNGFTPLYMAAQENHDGCVRYLLSKGANQTLATEDGFTPLAVAMQQGHDKVVAVLLENDTRGKVRLPALHIAAKKDDVKAAALLLQNEHNPDVTSKSGFTPLHIAAHYGNDKVASLLYEKGADVNYTAKHNITPLHVAAKWGKLNMATLLVSKGADIQAKTRDGLTPLHCAARSGHEQVVDILLENGAPMHAKTKNGLAPLHMAAQGEHVDAARILLYHGAPVDEVTVDYLTALHVAAHCGHVRVAKLLLDRGADPNARALNGFTPLHIACKKNRIKMVELLLKHGASISATTESGLTPLHVASFMGCMNIVIYLLQHDASPDIPTVRGETPLHLAARANQTDIIRILLRNGAAVDAKAREEQTPLHVASRLGNVDIVMLLLQHGAQPHATTKDLYTPLHIAAKEGQEEVASVLLDNGADLTATTKKGFTPLHLAAKYGHLNVARLLLQRDAPADAQGKNGVTPLHVAAHYDHQPVALLLLDKGASPHATAKNGHTPLHIAARKNQMDIATTLLEYGAKADAESKAGFTPLHLSSQEGHSDMSSLLLEHQADPNHAAKNGLTPLHLCSQEDRVPVANILLRSGAKKDSQTKQGYTPLHVACHHGHVNMVRLLIEQGAEVNPVTTAGYTPLHQAAQQGHVLVISLLLKNKADPNAVTNNGQTALGIANKLGYISVVEELKVVTETNVTTTTTVNIEEKYKVVAPEAMQETFMSDSEDEGGDDPLSSDQQQYKYMTVDDMKSLGDDSMRMDVTNDEYNRNSMAPSHISNELIITPQHAKEYYASNASHHAPDNVDIKRQPKTAGLCSAEWSRLEHTLNWLGPRTKGQGLCRDSFLVSVLVDARGAAMRGCRHSGVRMIVPPKCAASPTRITCRYVRPQRTPHPPPLMEGEALASRLLELGPVGAKFLGPVILEVPHFASLRGKQREIIVLRSDNGETWKEHTLESNEEAIQDVLNHSFEGQELNQIEDLHTNRITRIVTSDFPHYFAVVSRIRQEVHAIGPDGGTVSSTAVPLVQAVFPPNALTKKIRVGLQAQAIDTELVSKLLGHGVAVSPIVTVEPRRRKFHKAITLSMPAPRAHSQGMINQYSGSAPTLRLLCSITGGQNKAVWEDVTGSTPLNFVRDCVSFTTTVSARFWLMDCRNVTDAAKMATELYNQSIHVPFMAKFVVFAKRVSNLEARIRVFCMTDDKEDKTLEHQEHFTEIAKSRDIEVLEGKDVFMEFAGNLVPVLQSGDQPRLGFKAFRENRLAFTMRLRDQDEEPLGRIIFMNDAKVAKGEPNQVPLCTLNLVLPKDVLPDRDSQSDLLAIDKDHSYLQHGGISKPDTIHKADIRVSDISNLLDDDWEKLALELDIAPSEIKLIKDEYPDSKPQQATVMLRLWLKQKESRATGNQLELALNKIGRSDIVNKCICNVELVTDDMEKVMAKMQLEEKSGFDYLKDELGPSRDTSLRRDERIDQSYKDSQDDISRSEKNDDLQNENVNKDSTDTLDKKPKTNDKNEQLDNIPTTENANEEVLEEITKQFNKLQTVPNNIIDTNGNTPPPSPADFNTKELNFNLEKNDTAGIPEELVTSTPLKKQVEQKHVEETFSEVSPMKKQVEEEIIVSEPVHTVANEKPEEDTKYPIEISWGDPIAVLRKNVSDTLTFLHQERNDFLPEEDIIIPTRKDDHVSKEIDLGSINRLSSKKQTSDLDTSVELSQLDSTNDFDASKLKDVAESEIEQVIEKAENVVNEMYNKGADLKNKSDKVIRFNDDIDSRGEKMDSIKDLSDSLLDDIKNTTEDSLDNLESLKDDSISVIQEKSEEAFKFLEQEASSPIVIKETLDDSITFINKELDSVINDDDSSFSKTEMPETSSKSPKSSSIPVAKPRQKLESEKGIDMLFDDNRDSTSPDADLLSKIPVIKGGKIKTIKKHSKDPLKEFVTLSKDVKWDDDDDDEVTTKVTTDPIVKTTVTRITTETVSPEVKSKIPVLHPDSLPTSNIYENVDFEMSPKSKIPVLKTETTRIMSPETTHVERTVISPTSTQVIETTIVSPGSRISTKSSTLDSDSDDDSQQSPVLKGILKKTGIVRTVGSSSGSDVALHEEGAELSEDDSEDFYHHDPQYTETKTEEIDPVTGAKITKIVKTMSQVVTTPGGHSEELKEHMQSVIDQFMAEERNPH
ncbi:ankyrin-3-like isoform X5 [Aethina tumida]|uniref:ankyrin-3-like isoform X5 n=1 Tax=Aethina tumida TaxID=116153 RepID=UPI0021472411|nr:ankyrin-3-like isoform X5 [Aethina tumida]